MLDWLNVSGCCQYSEVHAFYLLKTMTTVHLGCWYEIHNQPDLVETEIKLLILCQCQFFL